MQYMYIAKWTKEGGWKSEGVQPFGNLSMPPSAQVLNYGQALFEGMKALTSAKDRIVLFRPLLNAQRMRNGAQRMCMAELPENVFLQGVVEHVEANKSHVSGFSQANACLTVSMNDQLSYFNLQLCLCGWG
jgi:branched-chain amino acid aminotransferase